MTKPLTIVTTIHQQEEVYQALKAKGKADRWENMMRVMQVLNETQIQAIKDKYK